MNQLDDETRRALCAGDQPPPGVQDRILASIMGPVGSGGSDPGSTGASSGPSPGPGPVAGAGHSGLVYALEIVGATLGLTAVGVALVVAGAAGIRQLEPPPAPRVIEAPSERDADLRQDRQHEQDGQGQLESSGVGADSGQAAPLASTPGPRLEPGDRAGLAATPDASASPMPTIEAELALMKAARESEDAKRALATLDQHQREFPTGVFAVEREVLRVESLCALGRRAEAEAVALRFVANYPGHPLRSRVEPSCED